MISFFPRRRRDADLDDEIRAHLSMAVDERVARGESREAAERAVRREFGNVAHVKEVTRGAWGGRWVERLVQDARFGVRSLLRAPGFAAVAVLTIALGIGVTTAMFTVVNGVLLQPLPFADPDRLVTLSYGPPRGRIDGGEVLTDRQFLELRQRPSPFAGMTTFSNLNVTLTGAGDPVRLNAAAVTTEFLDVLGVSPAIGPGFAGQEREPEAAAIALLSDRLWRSRFAADSRVVGTTVTLDGVPRTVVGVMPPDFDFPNRAELWIPLMMRVEPNNSTARPVVARLRDGVTMEQGRSGFTTLTTDFEWWGRDTSGVRAAVIPLETLVVGDVRRPLLIFTGAVALVLLIACTNVCNLLLMRAGTRGREIAVRAALGAGRTRLIRQLLTESMLIAALGGIAGMLLAVGGVRALLAIAPAATLPRLDAVEVDRLVLAFTVAVVVLTGIGFGLAPAFQATRGDLRDSLAESARTHSPRQGWLRGALVIAQICTALVLLAGAGLLVRSFQRMRAVDLGFRPDHVLAFAVELPRARYGSAREMQELHERVLDGLARIPEVDAAGAVNWRPLGAMSITGSFRLERAPAASPGYAPYKLAVSPGYFRAMGIRLRRGRAFTARDGARAPGVVVISQSVAERSWRGEDPIGRRLAVRDNPTAGDWLTVVGVVDDVVQQGVTMGTQPALYQPLTQVTSLFFLGYMTFVVHTTSPELVAPAMRVVVHEADPHLPVQTILTMDRLILSTIGDQLFQTRLLGTFSVLALLLAAVGIYGAMAYSVAERRHEIGIRMALGARAADVVRLVLGRTLWLVVPGLLLGTAVALALTRVLARFLFGIEPNDPATFATVGLLLGVVAIAAALVPARRAAQVDAVQALKG